MSDINTKIHRFDNNSIRLIEHEKDSITVGTEVYKTDNEVVSVLELSNMNGFENSWIQLLEHLNTTTYNRLEINTRCYGGNVKFGVDLIQIMDRVYTTTVMTGVTCSIAALVYLYAESRIIYKHSRLMVHIASAGVNGKLNDMESSIAEIGTSFGELMEDIVFSNGFLTDEEIVEYKLGKDLWFGYKEMIVKGMATIYRGLSGDVVITDEIKALCADKDDSVKTRINRALILDGAIKITQFNVINGVKPNSKEADELVKEYNLKATASGFYVRNNEEDKK